MELLRVTKGRTAHDSLECVAPIQLHENGDFYCEFYIEAWRYYDGEKALEKLYLDKEVQFIREPENVYDLYAIEIKAKSGLKLGYVPAVYNEFFSFVLCDSMNKLHGARVSLINKDAIPQMKVAICVSGTISQQAERNVRLSPLQTIV